MPWGLNSVQQAYAKLLQSVGMLAQTMSDFPKMEIGVELYPQLMALSVDMSELARAEQDFRLPLEKALMEVILPSIKENFNVGGRPPWKPLAKTTVSNRGSATPILVDSGTLQSKATSKSIWQVTKDDVHVQNLDEQVSYASYIQGGTRNMVARQFIMIQDQDFDAIERIFSDWWEDLIRTKGGFK